MSSQHSRVMLLGRAETWSFKHVKAFLKLKTDTDRYNL